MYWACLFKKKNVSSVSLGLYFPCQFLQPKLMHSWNLKLCTGLWPDPQIIHVCLYIGYDNHLLETTNIRICTMDVEINIWVLLDKQWYLWYFLFTWVSWIYWLNPLQTSVKDFCKVILISSPWDPLCAGQKRVRVKLFVKIHIQGQIHRTAFR